MDGFSLINTIITVLTAIGTVVGFLWKMKKDGAEEQRKFKEDFLFKLEKIEANFNRVLDENVKRRDKEIRTLEEKLITINLSLAKEYPHKSEFMELKNDFKRIEQELQKIAINNSNIVSGMEQLKENERYIRNSLEDIRSILTKKDKCDL